MKKLNRIIALIAVMLLSVNSYAVDYTLNEGVNYLKGLQSANCTFTATKDCTVLIECQELFNVTCNDVSVAYETSFGAAYSYSYVVKDVKKGDVITVSTNFVLNTNSSLRITQIEGVIPVQVVSYSQELRTVFSWNYGGLLSVTFNKAVSFSGIELVAGGKSYSVDDIHGGSNIIGFNIYSALSTAIKEGKAIPGKTFSIRITGICDAYDVTNLYANTGTLALGYYVPELQSEMVRATVGGQEIFAGSGDNTYVFKSYYDTESDADGIFVFEFDSNIKGADAIYLSMGSIDRATEGLYHRSSLPYVIDGNKIVVDVRGTLRSLNTLFPNYVEDDSQTGESISGAVDFSHLIISLINVIDANNNVVHSNGQGSIGSFEFYLPYQELEENIVLDGDNVAEGDAVKAGQTISLWVSEFVKFDAVKVSYLAADMEFGADENGAYIYNSASEQVREFTMDGNSNDGYVVSFVMPEMQNIGKGKKIYVTLANAKSANGMPHDLTITFVAAEGIADGIVDVTTTVTEKTAKVFNLAGQSVGNDYKGLVIVGGKKYMRNN